MAKKKVSRSRAPRVSRQRRRSANWLLPLLLGAAVFLCLFLVKGLFYDGSNNASLSMTHGYTGPTGNFTLMYPDGWTKEESYQSNGTTDNTKDPNTVTFTGDEGDVVITWGVQDFDGGCPPGDYKDIRLKSTVVRGCNGVSSDGTMYWSGISNNASGDNEVEVKAKANIPTRMNSQTIEAILQTLEFN